MRGFSVAMMLAAAAGVCSMASAQKAEIANIFPDFVIESSSAPHIITGEDFDDKTQIWTWTEPSDEKIIRDSAEKLGQAAARLPVEPPKGAGVVPVIDVERQAIVANLGSATVAWATSPAGFSRPYLLNVAKPFWLSDAKAPPGALLHMYGFGLRPQHYGPTQYAPKLGCFIVLKSKDRTVFAQPILEGRSTTWITDGKLVYFTIPADTPPGQYEAYIHNGHGGQFGWQKAGDLEVTQRPAERQVLDIRKFNGKGDGLADDTQAIRDALAAAGKAAPVVVFLPPGTYRTSETIMLPAGVTLRGAGRDNTIVQGFGFGQDPAARPAAVVRLTNNTGLETLAVTGAVAKGVAGDSILRIQAEGGDGKALAAPVVNVSILDCRIRPLEEDVATRRTAYLKAITMDSVRGLNIFNNEIHGSIWFRRGERMEIIRNNFRDCTPTIVVSIHGWASDSLLDSNIFTDTPGRICFYPVRHNYIRFNEVHQAFRGSWTNAEEIFLVHGTYGKEKKFVGYASAAAPGSLTAAGRNWASDVLKDGTVLIIAGKGFGQYRRIVGNTADTLTIDKPWTIQPDATSEYMTGFEYVENCYYANLNDTPLRMSLWFDCVANIVEMHRDAYSKGIDITAGDQSSRQPSPGDRPRDANDFLPAYYNMILDGWTDGAFLHLAASAGADNTHQGPPAFGNYIVRNKVRQPHMARTGFEHNPRNQGGILVANRQHEDMSKPQDQRVAASHTIVAGNYLSYTDVGIVISDLARKTFILGNEFQNVDKPILDWGARTILSGNHKYWLDEKGGHNEPIPDSNGPREITPATAQPAR